MPLTTYVLSFFEILIFLILTQDFFILKTIIFIFYLFYLINVETLQQHHYSIFISKKIKKYLEVENCLKLMMFSSNRSAYCLHIPG